MITYFARVKCDQPGCDAAIECSATTRIEYDQAVMEADYPMGDFHEIYGSDGWRVLCAACYADPDRFSEVSMSAEVKVTPLHRLAAYRILHDDLPLNESEQAWVDTGERPVGDLADRDPVYVTDESAQIIAAACASAEHNLRAALIDQLDALVINSHLMHGDHGPEYVYADSLRNLIDDLRAQQ